MIAGYFDPYVVACPPSKDGLRAFEEFVEALLLWRDATEDAALTLYSSNRSYDVLHETGHYPLWEPISERLSFLGIRHIQAKDVVDVAHRLLTRTQAIEDVIGLSEFLFDHDGCQLPASTAERPRPFLDCLVHLGLAIYFRRLAVGDGEEGHVVLSRGIEPHSHVLLAGVVADGDGPRRSSVDWPVSVECSLRIVTTPTHFLECLDAARAWVEGLRTRDQKLLLLGLREAVRRKADGADCPDWSVNPAFVSSAFDHSGIRQDGVARALLRACVETIVGEHLGATHHIRAGQGAQEPQVVRTRDGAGAWRRDVDHEYHLHYWQRGNSVELASVVVHNDLSIPD